jgi:hypothetical protein
LVDLQYKLIYAFDTNAAYHRALELGAREVQHYENAAGEQVCWQFVGLHDLHEIEADSLQDGAEVYSRMERVNPGELVRSKEQLEAFWSEANKHRTAAEILDADIAF